MANTGIQGQITDAETVEAMWGEEFVQFVGNPRIVITETDIMMKLKRPVTDPETGNQTDIVRINEPTVGEMKTMDGTKGDIGKTATLFQTMTGVTAADCNRVKASDFLLFNKVLSCFFADGLETGETA